jgi:sialic acid synthase SpsE
MVKVKVIADPGSCHMGNLHYAAALIDAAKDAGAWAIKFQLFPKRFEKNGNIKLSGSDFCYKLVPYAREQGIEIFASVFSVGAYKWVRRARCKYVKFAFGQYHGIVKAFKDFGLTNVFASGNSSLMPPLLSEKNGSMESCMWLYCIPEYPVKRKVSFKNLFGDDNLWCGFSDHTLGTKQTMRAIDAGAKYIEKHLRLDIKDCDRVPDGKFAVTPKQLREICKYAGR